MTTFAALGDSITLGVGDPVQQARLRRGRQHAGPGQDQAPRRSWRGWAALLAQGLPEPALHNLATNGARAADVANDQLPLALALRPDVASVVIGINDTLRSDFDPRRIAAAAGAAVGALRQAGAEVLTMRLPDPGRMLGMPGLLARPIARRAHQVNAVMDEVAQRFGTLHFDASAEAEVYDPRMWAVDRLHPSERGHRLIARRFHAMLAAAGHPVAAPPAADPSNPPPTRAAEVAWLATMGTAWVLRRSTDLVPGLLALAAAEWRAGPAAEPVTAGDLAVSEVLPVDGIML
jgi:lysophospholipase L1-like esterase